MKNSEKARLQEIYDQIEDLKSELEDLVDGLGDDDGTGSVGVPRGRCSGWCWLW